MSVVGPRADNAPVSDTSPPPLHLDHPAVVSLLLVRQSLSVKLEIKGELGELLC